MAAVLVLLAAGAALAGVLVASSGAASEPTQIEYMCSPLPSGQMRYVKSLSSCTQQEKKVAVYPGPQYLCVSSSTVTLGSASGTCPSQSQKTKVPGGPPSFYCANKATGKLRGVNPGLPCTSGENQMAIGPDVPPTVTSTAPADGTQNVPLNSTISVTFDQSVQATTSSFTLECPVGTPKSYTLSASPATTFTLTPSSALPVNTTCKVTVVAANIVDADGDLHMVNNYSFSFKTIAAPQVTSTSPTNGATGVATQATITINFSQSVNATGTAFKLECPTGTPKTSSQSATPATSVTLTPSSPMPVSTVCTVTVVASQVTDASNGTPMLANYVFSFTIDSPPTVSSTVPTNGATAVATSATVTVNFSEQVAATTSSFKLECPTGTPVAYSLSSSPASSFTLTPNSPLPQTTVCTVTVVAAQVHDTDANTPLQADYVFSFTTVDAAPFVSSTTPTNGASPVATNTAPTVTFSEPVTLDSGALSYECPTGTPVAFTQSGGPTTFTLTPNSSLPQGTTCTVKVTGSKVHDVDSVDPPDTMAADYSFSFTTDTAPAVTTTSPTNGATGVLTSATVTVNFNEPVTATTSSFKLECPTGTPVAYSLSSSPASSFTLTPTSALPQTTVCTVTVVANQIHDTDSADPPDTMASNYVFSFTTVDAAPFVQSTTPTNGANPAATNTAPTVTFSEPVTLDSGAMSYECPTGTPVTFNQTGGPTTFTLTPTSSLPQGTTCTVTVTGSKVHDVDSVDPPDTMAADYSFSFTTDIAPDVSSTSPVDGASNVATSSTLTVNFTEPVNATTSSFTLKCDSVDQSYNLSSSPASTFTLTPSSNLPVGSHCELKVIAAQITDVDGADPPDNPPADRTVDFTTADTAPTVQSTTPADGATNVSLAGTVQITFSEPVTLDSGAISLECPTGTPVAFNQTGGPTTFTLTPTSHLPSGTHCTATVTATKVHDVDTVDPPDTMAADYTFAFDTANAPSVTSTVPANNATGVATNATITVNFDRSVNASTSSFTVECPTGTPIAYSLSSSPASSFTLTPNSPLPGGVTCTVTVVAAQVTDASTSTPMDSNYVFSFTTDVPPTVSSTSPANGALDVNTGSTIQVTFSEQVNASGSSFSVECPTGTPIPFSLSSSPATTFTLTPTSNLPAGTICSVTVHAAQVTDVDAGSPMTSDYSFSFTTDTPPTVTSTVPTNGAVDVNAGSTITINFSKSVSATGSAFSLECPTGTPESFNTSSSPASSYTLTPTSNLPAGTVCTVTVHHTQITDASSTTMASDYVFSFTVDTPPAVTTTSPTNGATLVPLASTITINFSKSVTNTSGFSLECPVGTPIAFNTSSSPASSYTLTPTSNLPADTTCTVTVHASGIKDASNTNMAADYVFSFHTVLPPPDAVNDGPSTDYAATGGVPINIGSGIGVLNNDTLWNGSISSYGASTGLEDTSIGTATATAQGGLVTLNTDGGFHYEPPSIPPAGGTDTFKYTLTNTGGSDTATVTLNVTNQIIFVDGSANSVPETGSIEHPYNALGDVPSGRNTGGVLFFYSGTYTRNDADGVTLKNSEHLVGQGVSLASNLPFTLAPDSVSLPSSSTNPTISTTFAGGNAITLGSGNTVKGLTAGAAPGASISGGTVGTLTITNTSINNNGTGGGLSIGTSGAFAAGATLDSLSASPSSGSGVSLTSVTGSLAISAGSVSANTSGNAFNVSGGSVSVTDSGNLSQAGSGALLNVAGGHTGTLTFQTGTLSATGGTGLAFNNADGTYTLSNGSTLNGSNAHLDVSNGSSGTMTLNSSPVTNPTGTAVNVNASAATVTDSGTISKTSAGLLLDIESNTGGSVGLSGNLSSTSSATGIKLASNTGGTYTFSGGTKTVNTGTNTAVNMTSNTGATAIFSGGGLAITTTSGNGFVATGGGTVNVSGTGNTISSTTGIALDVANTTIGASNLIFQSISANGGTNGIIVDTTGASGGLHVTGTGSSNTGGTIQSESSTNGGVYLNSTKDVQLSWMHLTNFPHGAIRGGTINGFSFSNSTIDGTEGTDLNTEGDVYLTELTGTSSIASSTLTGAVGDDFHVLNTAAATLNLTVTGSTFSNAGDDGMTLIGGQNAGDAPTINADISTSTFTGNIARGLQAITNSAASMSVNVGKNGVAGSGGTWGGVPAANLDLDHNSSGNYDFNVENATFTVSSPSTSSLPVNIFNGSASGGSSLFQGRVINNTITGANNQCCSAIDLTGSGPGTMTVQVSNNTVTQIAGGFAIGYTGAQLSATNTSNITITNNTITLTDPNSAFGIQVSAAASSSAAATVTSTITGNTVNANPGPDIRVDDRFAASTLFLSGYGGANNDTTAISNFLKANNTHPSGTISTSVSLGIGSVGHIDGTGSSTPLPTNPNP